MSAPGAAVMKPVLVDLASEFERTTGHKLTITYESAGVVRDRVQAGESADKVVAYYTPAAGGVNHDECPTWAKRNMPNPVPVIVLGRLAVSAEHQGNGIGKHLLREAMIRTLAASGQIGARAPVVHAIEDEAVSFYVLFGFQNFPTVSRTLFLPMETIAGSL